MPPPPPPKKKKILVFTTQKNPGTETDLNPPEVILSSPSL